MSFKNLCCDWEISAATRCKTSLILSKSFKSFIASELFQLTVLPVTVLPRALDKSELPKSLSWTSIMYRHLEAVSKRPINLRHFKALTDHTTIILSLVVPCAQFLSFFWCMFPMGRAAARPFAVQKLGAAWPQLQTGFGSCQSSAISALSLCICPGLGSLGTLQSSNPTGTAASCAQVSFYEAGRAEAGYRSVHRLLALHVKWSKVIVLDRL